MREVFWGLGVKELGISFKWVNVSLDAERHTLAILDVFLHQAGLFGWIAHLS